MIKYEELVADPDTGIGALLEYLNVPFAPLLPFQRFCCVHGGDMNCA